MIAALCSKHKPDSVHLRISGRDRLGCFGVVLLGALSAMLSSCGAGTTALPGNLQSGGAGFITITSASIPDAIEGRSYQATVVTNVTGIQVTCALAGGSLPAALGEGKVSGFGSDCVIDIPKVQLASSPATIPIIIQASNSVHSNQRQFNLTVRQDYSFVQQTALLDGVQGRTYGVPFGGQTFSQLVPTTLKNIHSGVGQVNEVGNGPIVCSLASVAPQAGSSGNPGLAVATDATGENCLLESAGAAALTTAGADSVTIQAMDNPIPDPNNPGHNAVPGELQSITLPLVVHPPLKATLTQGMASNPAVLLAGVVNRSYGVIGAAPTYTASGGLGEATNGVGPYLWCVASGASSLPTGLNGNKISATCGISTSTKENTATLQTATGATIGSTGTFPSVILQLDDSGNAAVPNSLLSRTSASSSNTSLTIEPALNATFAQNGAANPANLLNGVVNRSYGVANNGAGAVAYDATGGLGAVTGASYGAYRWCVSSGSASLPAGLNGNGISASCGTTTSTIINTPMLQTSANNGTLQSTGNFPGITLRVDDPGNAAVPDSTSTWTFSNSSAASITVEPALVATLTQQQIAGATPVVNPPNLLDGGLNRTYGVTGGPPTYTATGGLGSSAVGGSSYRWCIKSGSVPANLTLSTSPSPGNVLTTTCSTSGSAQGNPVVAETSGSTVISGSAGTYAWALQVDDGGNAAVPSSFADNTSAMSASTNLAIHPQIPNAATNDGSNLVAAQGRSYGANTKFPALSNLTYTVLKVGGLIPGVGPSPASAVSPVTLAVANTPAGISCAMPSPLPDATQPQTNCNSAGAPLPATAATSTVQVTASDPGNLAVPGASEITNDTLSVVSALQTPALTQATNPAPTVWLPGVSGRSYGVIGGAPTYTASGGLGAVAGSASKYVWCIGPNSSPLPGGLGGISPSTACGVSSTTTGGTATLTSSSLNSVSTQTVYGNLQVELNDTGNSAVPDSLSAGVSTTSTPASITVNPVLSLTPPASLLPAVAGRSYGSAATGCSPNAQCSPAFYTVAGGLGGYASGPIKAGPLSCVLATGQTYACSSTSVSGASGALVSLTVSDAANATAPSASVTNSSLGLTINPEMTFTTPVPTGQLATAVTTRSYGSAPSGCSVGACAPVTYTIASGGGLGGYSFTGNGYPADFTCTQNPQTTLSCSSASVGETAAITNLSATVSDMANQATPKGTVQSTQFAPVARIPVNPEMTLTPPSGSLPAAVTGRRYGAGTGCLSGTTPCAPVQFGITGGLRNYQQGMLAGNPGPDSLSCPVAGGTYSCSTGTAGSIAGTSSPESLLMSAPENGNVSTPGNTITNNSTSLTIDPEMTLTPPSGSLATAVTGRRYGAGTGCPSGATACAPVQFGITGGLGNYQQGTLAGNPGPDSLSCPVAGGTYSCSTGTAGSIAGTSSPESLLMSAPENGNASTPKKTVTNNTKSLPINAKMQLTAVAPPNAAVVGRSYGQGSTCAPGGTAPCATLNYTIAGGLGNFALTGGITYDTTGTFSCSLSAATYGCSTASVVGSGSQTLTMSASENGNASTPGGIASDNSQSLPTNAALALPAPTPSPIPDAVTGRTYGEGSPCSGGLSCAPLAYNPTGGLTPYTFTSSNFPAPISCVKSGSDLNCSGGAITGSTSTGSVSVTDTANTSTPAGSANRTSDTITVESVLAITNTASNLPPPNALLEYPYSFTFAATGGLPGAYTWVPPGSTSGACSVAPTGKLPTSLSLSAATGVLSGTPTASSASDSDFTFQICVTDTANDSTPAGSALPNTTGNNFTVSTLDTFAYVADPGLNQVEVINTGTPTVSPSSTVVAMLATTSPDSVAITPNGKQAFVTLSTSKEVEVIDTITNSLVKTISLSSSCTSPAGVAITPDGTEAYIACGDGDEVDVVDTQTDMVTQTISVTGTPIGVAFKPDGTRAYVTLSTSNELAIINVSAGTQISGSPFALSAANTTPLGIVVTTNSGKDYAYVAKQNPSGAGAVDVVDVTSDPTTNLSIVTNITNIGSSGSMPNSLALTTESPDPSRVYLSLSGTSQFAILDNTAATPVLTGVFNLPDPTKSAGTATPEGVAIPPLNPLPTNGLRVFIAQSGASDVGVLDNLSSPVLDKVPSIDLGVHATPNGVAAIPVAH